MGYLRPPLQQIIVTGKCLYNWQCRGAFECWSHVYNDRIRRANVLLTEIKRYGVEKFGEEWSNVRMAEVRFARAFSYYRLIRVYGGGIILRTDISGTNGGGR